MANATALPTTDIFGQHTDTTLSQDPNVGLTFPGTSNALSLWNPSSISAASPNTLLASLFGNQSNDLFQPASIYDMPVDPLRSDHQQYSPDLDGSADSAAPKFFAFNGFLGRNDPPGAVTNNNFNDGLGSLTELDPFLFDNPGSSDSTPISLNSNTAYNSNFANFVRPEYRNRPEHPAYLYQLQMIEKPDSLNPYFPTLEQRHQVRSTCLSGAY